MLFRSALAAYAVSRRVRYFGNTAPLLATGLLALAAVSGLAEDTLAYGAFPLRALPFVFLFLGGVAADMLETRSATQGAPQRRDMVLAMVGALLASHAIIGVLELKRTGGSGHPFHVEVQGQRQARDRGPQAAL